MMKLTHFLGFTALMLTLGGCGTSSQTRTLVSNAVVAPEVRSARIALSDSARQRFNDNPGFSQAQLEAALRNELSSRRLINPASRQTLDIVVTDLRVRHGAAVFFAGSFAGEDYLVADVSVKDQAGKVLKSVDLNVKFRLATLGNIGTAQRNEQMYAVFARRVAAVIDPSIPTE